MGFLESHAYEPSEDEIIFKRSQLWIRQAIFILSKVDDECLEAVDLSFPNINDQRQLLQLPIFPFDGWIPGSHY